MGKKPVQSRLSCAIWNGMGQRIHEMPQIDAARQNGKDQEKKSEARNPICPPARISHVDANDPEHRALTLSRDARR
jgi:hypothetical protein